ncbi:MAG: RHS repeat domain-containing protein [Chthoniobacterales bacterium]
MKASHRRFDLARLSELLIPVCIVLAGTIAVPIPGNGQTDPSGYNMSPPNFQPPDGDPPATTPPDAGPPSTSVDGPGGDSPTGLTGGFGGTIDTGAGAVDAYERNASRSVTDIVVPGAVLPFTYSRTWNSRGGDWRSNWSWGIEQWESLRQGDNNPGGNDWFYGYTISFPDGRTISLRKPSGGPAGGPGTYTGYTGIFEYLTIDADRAHAHLHLTDGSVVTWNMANCADAGCALDLANIVDPFGQQVTISTTSLGTVIQEPGGRTITIGKPTTSGHIITSTVTTSLNQSVTYRTTLTDPPPYAGSPDPSKYYDITYNDVLDPATGTPIQAHYIYLKVARPKRNSNDPLPPDPIDRLVWGSDPMFAGPLKQVKYLYVNNPLNDLRGDPSMTAVLEEHYAASFDVDGVMVSRVEMLPYTYSAPSGNTPGYYMRKETRGEGTTRTISYLNKDTNQGQVQVDNVTDFSGDPTHVERLEYNWVYRFQMPIRITDMLTHVTQQVPELVLGRPTRQIHPDNPATHRDWSYDNPAAPYYVQTTTDENGKITTYRRDANHRVWRVEYPDSSFEEFTYNGFGQVTDHLMTSGGSEHSRYDSRGLKYASWPAPTESDPSPDALPTQYFYDDKDRLAQVTDPRGNSTWYQYNGRHQITQTTHQDGSYTTNAYNGDGTLAWTLDEIHPASQFVNVHKRTSFTYDEFKRVTSITDPTGRVTTKSYDYWDPTGRSQVAGSHLKHTSSFVFHEQSPGGVVVDQGWDLNRRLIWKRVATGTPDEATSRYTYDAVGNLKTVADPRNDGISSNYVTTFGYDERDRKTSVLTPPPLNELTQWKYDGVGNKMRETRPDNSFRTWDYDAMTRLWHAYDYRRNESPTADQTITYYRDLTGTHTWVTDQKGAVYGFTFDVMGRKIGATFPKDATNIARSESWHYDIAGNMDLHKNVGDQYEHREYDNRNRQTHRFWNVSPATTGSVPDWSIGPETTTALDFSSRMTSVQTNGGQTTVAFGYDDANRLLWEDQTVQVGAGSQTHRVQHDPDPDGNPQNTKIPGSLYNVSYDYTRRSQLRTIYDGSATPQAMFTYTYESAGNMTNRKSNYLGATSATNVSDIDALNRPAVWENTDYTDHGVARSHYRYDNLGRERATWRDEQAGPGDTFDFNDLNQLTHASYSAGPIGSPDATPTPAPTITAQPVAASVTAGQTATFSVGATGAPPLSYQWLKNGSNLGGATGASYTTPATTTYDNGAAFAVVVSNPGGSITSRNATLTVNAAPTPPPPPTISWQPIDCTHTEGETAFFNVVAQGAEPFTYQWKRGVNDIPGATSSTYSSAPVQFPADDGATFSVVVSNPGGTTTSRSATLHVNAAPPPSQLPMVSIDETGVPRHVTMTCSTAGATIFFTANATNYRNPTHNGGAVGDSQTFIYAGSSYAFTGTKMYFTAIAYMDGKQDSSPATLLVDYSTVPDPAEPDAAQGGTTTHTVDYTMSPLNRLSVTTDGGAPTVYQTGDPSHPADSINQYTTIGGQSLSYNDNRFNLTGYKGASYSFNAEGQMLSAAKGGSSMSCVYDGLGRVLKRTVDGVVTVYAYDGWKAIMEWDGAGTYLAWNVYGPGADELLWRYQVAGNQHLRYQYDVHGNVTALLDGGGHGLERYSYDAFGTATVTNWDGSGARPTSNYGNRFLFQGREYFPQYGIYDYRHRMYQPELGRFLQADPTGFDAGDVNLFRYCGDDPVDKGDPTGLLVSMGVAEIVGGSGVVDIGNARGLLGPGRADSIRRAVNDAKDMLGKLFNKLSGKSGSSAHFNGTVNVPDTGGNWRNRDMSVHTAENGTLSKRDGGGSTLFDVHAAAESNGSLTVRSNLNWSVERQSLGTDVVTRELQHVRAWRDWWTSGEGLSTVAKFRTGGFSGTVDGAAGYFEPRLQNSYLIERASQVAEFEGEYGTHNISKFPARPVSATMIENAWSAIP